MEGNVTSPESRGSFPVFATSIVCGEIHVVLDQLLIYSTSKSREEDLDHPLTTALDRLQSCLRLMKLFLSALLGDGGGHDDEAVGGHWADLPSERLLQLKECFDRTGQDQVDFLKEATKLIATSTFATDSIATAAAAKERRRRRALLAAVELVGSFVAELSEQDDDLLVAWTALVPQLVALCQTERCLGWGNPLLQAMITCILARGEDSLEVEEGGVEQRRELLSTLDLDSPLVMLAAERLAAVLLPREVWMEEVGDGLQGQVDFLCTELLLLAKRHWQREATRLRVPFSTLLHSHAESPLSELLVALRSGVMDQRHLAGPEGKVLWTAVADLCSLL
jgi:hypothetical protein